jgi:hypothetical protein
MRDLGPAGRRWLVTILSAALLLGHLVWPDLKIDAVTVALLAILILPWLSPMLQSLELPGGAKVTFREVAEAGAKVEVDPEAAAQDPPEASRASAEAIAQSDPNLALVALRIEIEKRLRTLARRHGIPNRRSLVVLLRELRDRDVLGAGTVSGLEDLIAAGNQAAHGVPVAPEAAEWAVMAAPRILATLDRRIARGPTAPDGTAG